ncbi:hypothetical protein ACS0TY_013895 [Phlomoides rotata]
MKDRFFMKILSIKSRGTNSCRKRKTIKNLFIETKAEMVCLQETKREVWGVSGALAIKGTWLGDIRNFNLINIYAPSGTKDQQRLWEDIQDWIIGQQEVLWCVCGDFNTVTNQLERKGGSRLVFDKRSRYFCKFIENSEPVDLPLLRRMYTWYKDNGTCCSRIDRFLLSQKWCSLWPNLKQTGLKRTFSDHAPILLEAIE